jgi:hypothetical protein
MSIVNKILQGNIEDSKQKNDHNMRDMNMTLSSNVNEFIYGYEFKNGYEKHNYCN